MSIFVCDELIDLDFFSLRMICIHPFDLDTAYLLCDKLGNRSDERLEDIPHCLADNWELA